MEDYKERMKETWKKIHPTSDPSEYQFKNIHEIEDSRKKDSSWTFNRYNDESYYTTARTDEFNTKLWIFIPLCIIIFIVLFCEHFISRSRSCQTDSIPEAPRLSGSRSAPFINTTESARITPSDSRTDANSIRPPSQGRSTEYAIGIAPTRIYLTPIGNNRQYLSLNNLRVDHYARPIGFVARIDLERSSGGAHQSRSMGDAELLSSDKPPTYSTVVSSDLSGATYPSVTLRDSAESPPPSYEERSICSR